MESIRTHAGEVRICASCGQPCGLGETEYGEMWQHFNEQWDGVYCPRFPLAGKPLVMEWDEMALKQVKADYRDARR